MRSPLLAEALGAYVLVGAGGSAAVMSHLNPEHMPPLGVALVFGLAVTIMIAAVGPISGAHFNPAVTLALAVQGHFPKRRVWPYWLAQCLGAGLGALTVRGLFGPQVALALTQPAGALGPAFVAEVLLTALLVLVIASVSLRPHVPPALVAPVIGGTVALGALVGGPISGASMNPARSLGPALVSGDLTHLWIYLTAPFLGGLVGILIYQLLHWEFYYEPA